ncbi:MAG: serine hydrolase domain-containing protein [Anaerolineales bacterium]|nr:serine hydrolase domain-containing protein [Anaerolineales bacterium]
MRNPFQRAALLVILLLIMVSATTLTASATSLGKSARAADAALDRALKRLVAMPGGPPAALAIVQRGKSLAVHAFGVSEIGTQRKPQKNDYMRIASIAKAFSGAAALALVHTGVLALDDTIGDWLPELPSDWHGVTLRQLLNHTSGLPDFSQSEAFQTALLQSLRVAPPPGALLAFVGEEPLNFVPGTQYLYSNSDNIAVGLIIEAATGMRYRDVLKESVAKPLRLDSTLLPEGPELPEPFIHGYDFEDNRAPEDVSEIIAAGWSWASGGIVSTPANLNRFVRGYVRGTLFSRRIRAAQREWVPGGGSEPPGPGRNSAGLGLFRYQTRCGTVFGHTGNTSGFTQFAAATSDGRRSVTVSMSLQRTQTSRGQELAVFRALRVAETRAVCAALARENPFGRWPGIDFFSFAK